MASLQLQKVPKIIILAFLANGYSPYKSSKNDPQSDLFLTHLKPKILNLEAKKSSF
jgi:hypothetical protein